jgi:hypothetical protein
MPSLIRIRDFDAPAWRTATWSAPVVIQLVFGAMLIAMWLLGKAGFHNDTRAGERATLLSAIGIAVAISSVVAGVLLRRRSPTTRGVGLGVAGSAAIVLIGGSVYAFWLF